MRGYRFWRTIRPCAFAIGGALICGDLAFAQLQRPVVGAQVQVESVAADDPKNGCKVVVHAIAPSHYVGFALALARQSGQKVGLANFSLRERRAGDEPLSADISHSVPWPIVDVGHVRVHLPPFDREVADVSEVLAAIVHGKPFSVTIWTDMNRSYTFAVPGERGSDQNVARLEGCLRNLETAGSR